jgi:sec-independent protein translocase protein TatC
MPKLRDEDLFKSSTMTFGEHLDELRRCLFKALVGLAVGVVAGLYFGGDVVAFVQQPLNKALKTYHAAQDKKKAAQDIVALEEGQDPNRDPARQRAHFVETYHMRPMTVYILPSTAYSLVERLLPEQAPEVKKQLPDTKIADMTPKDLIAVPVVMPSEDDDRNKVRSFAAQEPFSIYLKASLLVGVVFSSPWIFYQLWLFVAAGLYPHEKRYVHVFFPFSLGLFLAGAALAFFVVFRPVLNFLFTFNVWMNIDPEPRISEWLTFALFLPVGFGIGFQLPLVMLFLERIGVFSVKVYLSHWRISVLAISIIAMILTPPDPYSMMLMFGPLTVLYFGGILLCKLMPRRVNPLFGRWDEEEETG